MKILQVKKETIDKAKIQSEYRGVIRLQQDHKKATDFDCNTEGRKIKSQ